MTFDSTANHLSVDQVISLYDFWSEGTRALQRQHFWLRNQTPTPKKSRFTTPIPTPISRTSCFATPTSTPTPKFFLVKTRFHPRKKSDNFLDTLNVSWNRRSHYIRRTPFSKNFSNMFCFSPAKVYQNPLNLTQPNRRIRIF